MLKRVVNLEIISCHESPTNKEIQITLIWALWQLIHGTFWVLTFPLKKKSPILIFIYFVASWILQLWMMGSNNRLIMHDYVHFLIYFLSFSLSLSLSLSNTHTITYYGFVCYVSSNSYFYILNNITHIFIHKYFKKLHKSHFKLLYKHPLF